jgi:surfeit locus 1 family protein
MVVLTALFILLFVRLGFWQIQRADEKKKMLAAELLLAKQEAITWNGAKKFPLQYQQIKIIGTYLPKMFMLDNQHYQHQFGYDVLTPLVLENGAVVLIDRGWVPGSSNRRYLPNISTPSGLIKVQGSTYFPSKNYLVLGPGIERKTQNIALIEWIDTKMLSQILQKKVYPFIIRLDKKEAYGYVREWNIVSMPPERHLAYALQWFVMALVILIIFVALNLKKKNEETT